MVRPSPSFYVKNKLRKKLGADAPDSLLEDLARTIEVVGKPLAEMRDAGVPFDGHQPDQLIEIRDAAKRLRRALRPHTYPDPKHKRGPTTTSSMAALDRVAHDSASETWPTKTVFELPKILQVLEDATDTLHEPRGAGGTFEFWRFIFGVQLARLLKPYGHVVPTRVKPFAEVLKVAFDRVGFPCPRDLYALTRDLRDALENVEQPS